MIEAYAPHRDVNLSEISNRLGFEREVLEVECILEKAFDMMDISLFRNPFLPVQVKLRFGVLETFSWLISPLWNLVAQYAPAEPLEFVVFSQY